MFESRPKRAWKQEVVTVDEGHPGGSSSGQTRVAGSGQPPRRLVTNDAHPIIRSSSSLRDHRCLVGRAIINDNQPKIDLALALDTAKARSEMLLFIESCNNHIDAGHVTDTFTASSKSIRRKISKRPPTVALTISRPSASNISFARR